MHELLLIIRLEKGKNWPRFDLDPPAVCENVVFDDDTSQIRQYTLEHVTDSIKLDYLSKPAEETVIDSTGKILQDQTVEIQALHVDGIQLDKNFLLHHSSYKPRYRPDFEDYCKTHNIALEKSAHVALKFWHAGTWSFEFEKDFWRWYQIKRKKFDLAPDWQMSKYFGQFSPELRQQLEDLKKTCDDL